MLGQEAESGVSGISCQHCPTPIIEAYPDAQGEQVWINAAKDPNRHTLTDMMCMRGNLSLRHKPMPKIEVCR